MTTGQSTDAVVGRIPVPAYFVAGAIAQYLGAALAVVLFDHLAVAGVAWLRVAFAGLILVAWRRPPIVQWDRSTWMAVAAFGTVTAVMNLTIYLAIDRLPLGTAVAIEFLGPIAVAAFGSRTLRNALALLIATAGVLVLAEVQLDGEPLGVFFALCAAAALAGYIMLGARMAAQGRGEIGLDGLAVGMLIGALVIAPVGLPGTGPAWTSIALLAAAAVVAIASNVVPYGLDMIVLRKVNQAYFALLLALLPATAAIVGALVLGQTPSLLEVVGIGAVISAVLVRKA